MHDELIEQRLSAALREGADALPFTITAAELERRLALRRRSFAGRRLTLVLAAAVGISLVGVAGTIGGLLNTPAPTPTAPLQASNEPVAVKLATLNQLVAVDPGTVLVAQAHGPDDGPSGELDRFDLPPAGVVLGTVPSGSRVTVACLGPSTLQLEINPPGGEALPTGPAVACDGTTHEETVGSREPRSVGFTLSGDASWRAVVRGRWGPVRLPVVPDPVLQTPAGQEDLIRIDDLTIETGAEPWGISGLAIQGIGAVPPRKSYRAQAWCRGGSPIRYILGDVIDGAIVADTETQVACPPSGVWVADLAIAQPAGSRIFLAADPGDRVSLLLTSATPPVALTRELPGWQISGGVGPDLAFEPGTLGFSAGGDGDDHVQVVLACTGTESIEVVVEDGNPVGTHQQHFQATCSREGTTNSHVFKVTKHGVSVSYVTPKGAWTALSVLVPAANPLQPG